MVRHAATGYASAMTLLLLCYLAGVDRLEVLIGLLFVGYGFLGLVIPSEQSATMEKHLPALRAVSARIERATAHIPLETLLESHHLAHRT